MIAWKDAYRTGVDSLDRQHMELFRRVEALLHAIDRKAGWEEFRRVVAFLKMYVSVHFRDEEAHLLAAGYPQFAQHKQAHRNFIRVLLEHEKRLEETGYAPEAAEDLAGMLVSWLIYHVSHADLMAVQNITSMEAELPPFSLLADSAMQTLFCMARLDPAEVTGQQEVGCPLREDIHVSISLQGDVNGRMEFVYEEATALGLMERMLQTRPRRVDGMVCSALAEIANISMGNAATRLARQDLLCDITTPAVHMGEGADSKCHGGMVVETTMGKFRLTAELDCY